MIRMEHNEEKWIFPFVKYSLSKVKPKSPLIIQLHGAGEGGRGKDELKKVEVNGFSKYLETINEDCVVVMPQCPNETFWVARIESLISFIEQVIKEYDIDEDRVYLTGNSMGGYGTWFAAMARPDMFAAIAPMCGGGMAWKANVLKMPVWAFHGIDDETVSVTQSDEMIEKLRVFNPDVKYTRIDGVGHYVYKDTFNKELFEWLLSKKKNKE